MGVPEQLQEAHVEGVYHLAHSVVGGTSGLKKAVDAAYVET